MEKPASFPLARRPSPRSLSLMRMSRREWLKGVGAALAGNGLVAALSPSSGLDELRNPSGRIPLLHTTDLYHPPQDPDDQVDLATVFALEEFDLRGVVLDVTERFLRPAPEGYDIPREPGFFPVAQLNGITGRSVPVAHGPLFPLAHPTDPCAEATPEEAAGIELILETLRGSAEPVVVSVTGSPRALVAAWNRDPELVGGKVGHVILNAGSTGGEKVEWNVQLDPHAFVGLWRSDLDIHWYPPGTESGAFDPSHQRGTYWKAEHARLFRGLSRDVRAYFASALSEADLSTGVRNLWCTASLALEAGRALARTPSEWRFVPGDDSHGLPVWAWGLDPIEAQVDDGGRVRWEVVESSTNRSLFRRKAGGDFGEAMIEALNALLREL